MSTKQKTYIVGKRPPANLTAKAREQLDSAKPSLRIAALASVFARLFSTSSTGEQVLIILGLDSLKPGDLNNALTADEAAAAARKSFVKACPRKSTPRVK